MRKVMTVAISSLALSLGVAPGAFAAGQFAASAHLGVQLAPHANWAAPASSPEIDPAGALSGVTLLLGGLAMVRGRRAKK